MSRIGMIKWLLEFLGYPTSQSEVRLISDMGAGACTSTDVVSRGMVAVLVDGIRRLGVLVAASPITSETTTVRKLEGDQFVPFSPRAACQSQTDIELARSRFQCTKPVSSSTSTDIVPVSTLASETGCATRVRIAIGTTKVLLRGFDNSEWPKKLKESVFTNPLKTLTTVHSEAELNGDTTASDFIKEWVQVVQKSGRS